MNSLLGAAVRDATARLRSAGIESARVDAEELAAWVHGVERSRLHRVSDAEYAEKRFRAAVERRAAREPLQHITGRVGFRRLVLSVGPGVFVPRPESEVVAGWAIDQLLSSGVTAPLVVDLCTGSAALALSIADEVTHAQVHAVELDQRAHAWAARNARGTRVVLHRADAAVALPELDGRVDMVVSNPPYVADVEIADIEPEVRDHDPRPALVAGADGLDAVRMVERRARRLLRPGGSLVIEHSDRQGRTAPQMLETAGGWTDVADHVDHAGRDRFVTARWVG